MATLRANEVERFVQNPPDNIAGVLIYGPNEGRIAEISTAIVKSIIGSLDDPFNLVILNESQLKDTPGLLNDEMLALSFTGNRKLIWVKDPGAAFTRQLSGFSDQPVGGNLLLVQAGALKKTAAVRKTFETSKQATCIACYEDTARDLATVITQKLHEEGKSIDSSAIQELIESTGTNRLLILAELEKIISFCANETQITTQHIEALSSDPLGGSMDDLLDLTLIGDVAGCTSSFRFLISSGVLPAQILVMLSTQLTRLQKFRLLMDKGQNADSVIKNARPPVFFKKQAITKRQLTIWHHKSLEKALTIVFEAILLTRQNACLAESVCERALIALSKTAQANMR